MYIYLKNIKIYDVNKHGRHLFMGGARLDICRDCRNKVITDAQSCEYIWKGRTYNISVCLDFKPTHLFDEA